MGNSPRVTYLLSCMLYFLCTIQSINKMITRLMYLTSALYCPQPNYCPPSMCISARTFYHEVHLYLNRYNKG